MADCPLVSSMFPHGHGGAAAEQVLLGTARARHANGADQGHAVDNRHGPVDGYDVPVVRDDESDCFMSTLTTLSTMRTERPR